MSNYAGIFYKITQRLPDKCLKSIYFAFVCPHKILRILQNKPYRSPVKDLYTAYNTLPILFTYGKGTLQAKLQEIGTN